MSTLSCRATSAIGIQGNLIVAALLLPCLSLCALDVCDGATLKPGAESDIVESGVYSMHAAMELLKRQMLSELDVHLSDLMERQRDKLLSLPLLPGGTYDPALHPARHPLRDALVGAILTLLLGALTWFAWHRHQAVARRIWRRAAAEETLQSHVPEAVQNLLRQATSTRDLPAWVNFPDFERAGWVNAVVGRLWPHMATAASVIIREQLEPQLRAAKPRWISEISLHEFELGDTAPQLTGIKVYETDRASDTIIIEADGSWASHQDIQLTVRLLPAHVPGVPQSVDVGRLLLRAINNIIFLRVGVRNLKFSGRVRITLSGLLDRIPIVSIAEVSLVELPDFSFGITLYEALNVMILPGLEAFLHYFIRDIILRPYVLPESITIPLLDGAEAAPPRPVGMLFVHVVRAANIPHVDWRSYFSKPDCQVTLSVRDKQRKRTRVVWNKKEPVFDDHFNFLVHFPEYQELSVQLTDHNMGAISALGSAVIPIRSITPGQSQDYWLEMKPVGGTSPFSTVTQAVTAVVGGGRQVGSLLAGRYQLPRAANSMANGDSDQDVPLAVSDAGSEAGGWEAGEGQAPGNQQLAVHDGEVGGSGVLAPDTEPANLQNARHNVPASEQQIAGGEGEHEGAEGDAPCKLLLNVLLLAVGEGTLARAHAGAPATESIPPEAGGEQQEMVLRALRGGVLAAHVLHPHTAGAAAGHLARQVVVEIAGRRKMTAEARGEEEDRSKETLDFLIGGELVDRQDEVIKVEVWDVTFASSDLGNLTWEMTGSWRRATEPRRFSIRLQEVIRAKRLHRRWKLAGGGGAVLDLELCWMGAMADPDAGA